MPKGKEVEIKVVKEPVHDPRLVELKAAYADASTLLIVLRSINMGGQMKARRDRLLVAIEAFVKVEA